MEQTRNVFELERELVKAKTKLLEVEHQFIGLMRALEGTPPSGKPPGKVPQGED